MKKQIAIGLIAASTLLSPNFANAQQTQTVKKNTNKELAENLKQNKPSSQFTHDSIINTPVQQLSVDVIKKNLGIELNKIRKKYGLGELQVNDQLNQAAKMQAENIINGNIDPLDPHKTKDGKTLGQRLESLGYDWQSCYENFEPGYETIKDLFYAPNGWMSSQIHKKNILSKDVKEYGFDYVLVGDKNDPTLVWILVLAQQ